MGFRRVPKTVRGMDAAPGAPMEGFTAFFGARPDRGRLPATRLISFLAAHGPGLGGAAVPCADVLSHLNFVPLIETG